MNIKKLKKFFNYNIFYFLLILLLVISFTFQNIAVAQNTNQQQSNNSTEHFSLVLSLDPEGEAIVNYTFQQGNLLAIVYGNSNLKVIDLDTENIVYKISYPESRIHQLCLVGNYLLYWLNDRVETVRVDLSTKEKESISFPGSSFQITDDGHLITHHGNRCQLIDLDEGQKLFEPDVSKSGRGKILCVDDVIIFPFVDSQGNSAGYKAMSTNGEVKFTLKESFNKVRIFLPEYRSKISTFPIPILINRNYRNQDKEQWFLEFIDKEGQTIASYSPIDLGIDYSWNRVNSPLWVLDESKDNFLLQISSRKKGESQTKFYYILTDLSGNVLQVFDETSNCTAAIDSQGNILLHQVGGPSHILKYYQQNGTLVFSKQIPSLLEANAPTRFKFLSENEILEWEYGRFEKYSLTNGEMTGIYPISPDYHIYLRNTIIYDNKVYFFAKTRPRVEPEITGLNLFSFSAADSGWFDIEIVSIRPNAGTTYEVWDNTEVKVKFRTEYGTSFGENFSVNFEKGEVLTANDRNLEYTWHSPTIVSGSQDTVRITVSYGPVSQEFIITVKDHFPTASFAFNPISPQTGQTVHFDGSLSADLDGEISTYHWDFGDGTVELKQEQDYIDHIFSTAGEYLVTLTITDNNSQTAQINQNIKVKVAPKPPIANFKLLDPSPQWDTKVRFDASLSSDPDGSIVSYQWDFGDGTTGEGISVSHEFKYENRNFDVTLIVTDNQNLSSSKTIKVSYGWILFYENKGDIGVPAALIDGNNLVDYQVTVITGNHDDAGINSMVFIALYGLEKENGRYGSKEIQLWSYEDDFEKGNEDTFSVKGYNLDEIEFITLRHKNDQNKPGWYVKGIEIENKNNDKKWFFYPDQWLAMDKPPEHQTWGKFVPVEPPVASFIYSPTNPFIGELVSFDSSGSSDSNGTIVSYNWDFGDETSPGTEVISNHQFQEEGVYTVTLTVTDDEGLTDTITESFMVKKNLIGHTKAIIEWAWDSPVDISFPELSEDSINVLQSDIGTTPNFHVDWKIKDNSRTIGYSLYVASELKSYDFSTWDWVAGETEGHTKTGNNTRLGKYNNSGTWSLDPLQPNPVTKYKLTLTGKSYDESKEKSEEFYASLPITNPNISSEVRTAAPNWIAGRYELALIFRAMSQHWKNIKNSSLSEENYRKETERILGSTYCLFGSTTARGCATNLGLDFLEVAANVASSAFLSGAVAVTGPLNMAITYTTWAKDNLSWSAEHWDDIFSADSIRRATHTTTENDWESSLEKSLNELFPAILEEADESMNFIYSNGLVDDWYTKLQNENTKLGKVAEKALVAYNNAETIFIANGTSDAEKDVLEFLEFIIKMANSQTGISDEVLPD